MNKLNLKKLILVLSSIAISSKSFADLPLNIESLITEQNRFKVNASISYQNINSQQFSFQPEQVITSETGDYIYTPAYLNTSNSNTDELFAEVNLRHGINSRTDVGIGVTGLISEERITGLKQNRSTILKQYKYLYLDAQYQLLKNHNYLPNIQLTTRLNLFENSRDFVHKNLSAASININTYYINDPLVFSLSGTFQYNTERKFREVNDRLKPGNLIGVDSTLSFVVNSEATLSSGFTWVLTTPQSKNSHELNKKHTQTFANFGVSYKASKNNIVFLSIKSNISGKSGSAISLGISSNF